MQVGAGAAESNTLLTFLDMPYASTFHKTTFRRVQTFLNGEIKNISNNSMEECREEEIRETVSSEVSDNIKINFFLYDSISLHK